MIHATPKHDEALMRRLASLTTRDSDYWSFKGNSRREQGHALCQYPAMMVPQVARAVLEEACTVHPDIERVGDPFVGSGTILTETMSRGINFLGTDINPLAVLLCKAKAGPFFPAALREKTAELLGRIDADRRCAIEVNFQGRNKWFRRDVQISLSRIVRAIQLESARWARRSFWICLAETIRFSSNSRTSTVKLHTRPEEEIESRTLDPIGLFKRLANRNLQHITDQTRCLEEKGFLTRGHYNRSIEIILGDSRNPQVGQTALCDIILTSPPYGDNVTTVPYGQYSFLPLNWISLSDIDSCAKSDYLQSTHEIDRRSLGGSRRICEADRGALCDRSPALHRYLSALRNQPSDRSKRVVAFFRDLNACLQPMLSMLRPGGLLVWALGNRKVGGKRMPLDTVLADLLQTHHTRLLAKLKRHISSKRMAPKNSVADTMSTETILVMRKAT